MSAPFAYIVIAFAAGEVKIEPDLPNGIAVSVDEGNDSIVLEDEHLELIKEVRAVALGEE
jgi:hypothetical protein